MRANRLGGHLVRGFLFDCFVIGLIRDRQQQMAARRTSVVALGLVRKRNA